LVGNGWFLEYQLVRHVLTYANHDEEQGGSVALCANLWDAREHPRGALISALARAGSPPQFMGRHDDAEVST
jgi:hypothetical protein